ncbi:hypothetical protein IAE22_35880, partial [Bacillus sp. S34]|nr:hypothetical protein [Bacillus sp. S34]
LETEFENRRGEGIPAELHDLIAAVSVRDIHRWLLSPDPAPAVDYVTAEALAFPPSFLPREWRFDNYTKVFDVAPFG